MPCKLRDYSVKKGSGSVRRREDLGLLARWFEYYTAAKGSSGEYRSTHRHESSAGAGWSSTSACLCNAALPVMDGPTAEGAEQVQMAIGEGR